MGNKNIYTMSDKEFLEWVQKEAKRDMTMLTHEAFEEFQRTLTLGDMLARGNRTTAVFKEWAGLRRKMKLRNRTKQKGRSIRSSLTEQPKIRP